MHPTTIDRAQGALVGLGVGDALGGPLEFMSSEAIAAQYGGPVSEMVGGGWLHLAPGQITDDTQMTLCLARSLSATCGYDQADVLARYLDWLASDPLDVGATIASVLHSIAAGVSPDVASQQHHTRSGGKSAGNGSIMRIAPLACSYQTSQEAVMSIVRKESTLTHYDPLAAESCILVVNLIRAFLYAPEHEFRTDELEELINGLSAHLHLQVRGAALAEPAAAAYRVKSEMGFVLTALAVACTAVRNFASFEEGMVWAVNLGGDADTNGAVTGAVLGAKFGIEHIPERWWSTLQHREELEALAEELVELPPLGG